LHSNGSQHNVGNAGGLGDFLEDGEERLATTELIVLLLQGVSEGHKHELLQLDHRGRPTTIVQAAVEPILLAVGTSAHAGSG